ncbi:MAG: hypothetical protein II689_04460, partial [Firmicutes bacterium]|nr:hypothetical protein [Bacillota bacterium]
MFRILLKKQLRELTNFFFWDTRRNKKRSKGGIAGFALLFFFLFLSLGMMFFMMTESLMDAFISMDLVWMAFAIVSLLAVVFGIFGGIFNTYASMYNAKDNESLLAMPIAPRAILGARLVGVYLTGLLLVAVVMLPALACYIINSAPPAKNIIFGVLIIFAVSFFVLFLSCLLGWLVALISSRVRKKNIVTTVLSLAFLTGYYYVYFRAAEILKNIIANAGDFSHAFRTALYPFYIYGRATEGHLPSLLIAIFGGLLLVVLTWLVLSANFVGIVTRNKGAKKLKYDRSSAAKTSSVSDALFKRELRHFVSNSAYMLNCGLGLLLLIAAAV